MITYVKIIHTFPSTSTREAKRRRFHEVQAATQKKLQNIKMKTEISALGMDVKF
jgi:hypothetical protein